MLSMAISWFELRDARQLSGLTQELLARRMGVSIRSVQNYERPNAEIPRKAEHAIRRVLTNELASLKEMHERGVYESTPDSVLGDGAASAAAPRRRFRLNPRLAGISNTEMLTEMLAREEQHDDEESTISRVDVGGAADDVNVDESLHRLSPSELAELRKEDQALAAHRRGSIQEEQEGLAEQ